MPRAPQPPPFAYLLPAGGFGSQNAIHPNLEVPLPVEESQVVPPASGDMIARDSPHPDIASGYLVSAIHHWTQPSPTPTRGRAPAPKKTQVVKSDRMQLETMSRYELADACLSLHNLEDEYRPSKTSGFGFKMWWTGYSGGKAAAATVETDAEYGHLHAQLLASKKSAKDITVFVSFDTDEMDAFRRLRKRVAAPDPNEDSNRPKAPRLGDLDPLYQLHGNLILKLKEAHPCEKHWGEHGEVGYCYVAPDGRHIHINNRRFGIWAAAWAAGDASRDIPPNVPEFDGLHDVGPLLSRPRGRGPVNPAPSASPASSDATAILMAAMVPLLVSLTQSMVPRNGQAPPAEVLQPATDNGMEFGVATGFLFLPSHTLDCLLAFKTETGINIVDKAPALDHRDLTPDIIPEVPHEHLAGVLGVSEGKALKFQLFCRRWAKDFSRKQKGKESD